mgnify:CR=1 FL=1
MECDNQATQTEQEWSENPPVNETIPTNSSEKTVTPSSYSKDMEQVLTLREKQTGKWDSIKPEYAARMRIQNRFKTGLDIAK